MSVTTNFTSTVSQARDYSESAHPVRYPEPDVIALHHSFKKYILPHSPIKRLHTGTLWAEGPAWSSAGNYLIWSDIPNSRHLRRLDEDGHVSTMRTESNYANGNTFDYQGRLLTCEHGKRRVVRYEHDGSVTVLADNWNGKTLNAPNDIVVHPDGGIWFTDPGYGILVEYEGAKSELEIKEAVYRIDPLNGSMAVVLDDMFKPNGLCFSPDYSMLYVVETGSTHYPDAPKNIRVYDVISSDKLTNGREFCSMKLGTANGVMEGIADGIRADMDGNIWAGSGWAGDGYDGVHIFAPSGERIGQILLPEICANLCFGGPKRNRLFMTASQSLYAVHFETKGAHIA